MEDLASDIDSGALLRAALASGKPLGIVCHGPAAILATRNKNGDTPFANYRITGFSNDEEAAVGFANKAKWLLEDELKKLPTEYSCGPVWQPHTVSDRNLYTGQNPASSGPLATDMLRSSPSFTSAGGGGSPRPLERAALK